MSLNLVILNSFTIPETINEINLPEDLLDPGSNEEKEMRFNYLFHELFGKVTLEMTNFLKRPLTIDEIDFIKEQLIGFLKENGF